MSCSGAAGPARTAVDSEPCFSEEKLLPKRYSGDRTTPGGPTSSAAEAGVPRSQRPSGLLGGAPECPATISLSRVLRVKTQTHSDASDFRVQDVDSCSHFSVAPGYLTTTFHIRADRK